MSHGKSKQSFVIDIPPADLGVKQYSLGGEAENGQSANPKPKKKAWKSPPGIFLMAVAAFLTFWFLYSLINALLHNRVLYVLLSYGSSFLVVVACDLIIIFSLFGLWGKFARFAVRHGAVKSSEVDGVLAHAEMADAAHNDQTTYARFEVYENYVLASDGAEIKLFDRSKIRTVRLFKFKKYYHVTFASESYEYVSFNRIEIPFSDFAELQALFGDKLQVTDIEGHRGSKHRISISKPEGGEIAGLFVGLFCAAVGGGVIAMHFLVAPSIPIFLGAFFIVGGLIFMMTAFGSSEIVTKVFIPLLFGVVFTAFPPFVILLLISDGSVPEITGVHDFLCLFHPAYCLAIFLMAFGILFIIGAIWSLIKIILHRD